MVTYGHVSSWSDHNVTYLGVLQRLVMSDKPIEPEVIGPKERQRAYRIRSRVKVGAAVEPEDVAFLADFEARTKNAGASSSRKVSYTEEEHAAAGIGTAAEMAAAGMMAREEGRREDNLARIGMDALKAANELLMSIVKENRKQASDLQAVHLQMLGTVREQYLARTNAEIETMRAEAAAEEEGKRDGIDGLAEQLLPMLLERMSGGSLPAGVRGPRKGK